MFVYLETPKTTNLSPGRIFFPSGFWGGLLAFWWPLIGLIRSIGCFLDVLGKK